MVGVPVIINHKDITEKNADDERVGVVNSVWFDEKDGWFWCDGIIWDETAQNLITDKNWSVSCSYDVKTANDEGGSENNIKYDMEFLDGVFTHLALVDNPRYERANIVFNSKTEVVNSFEGHAGRPGEVGGSLPRQEMPTLEDFKKPTKDYNLPDIPDNILNKLEKTNKPVLLKKNIIEKNKEHHPDLEIDNYNDILNKGLYNADVVFKTKEKDDYYNFVHYDKKYHQQVLIELSETKENYEVVNFYLLDDKKLNKKLDKAIKRIDNEGGKFLIDIEGEASKVGSLSNLDIDSIYIINDIINDFNPNVIDNSKEQDMTLLEKIKELISTVENEKGDDMEDKEKKEVDNEKVDKRKLIDEVGGILKGKVDDEVIRTIIGKLEKVAYDDSEKSADNEKEEDKKEEEKAENKCKNESEEDKEKVEEVKEEEKKDVENKCKNSVENAKESYFDKMNKIYNSAVKPAKSETEYVSRADRLKAAEDYFRV